MPQKPNVLLITTDHWAAELLGLAGHPVIQTPSLNELAGSGTCFSRAYTECPVCIPARRTLMTGTTPRTHNDRVYKGRQEMPDCPTMAQVFRDNGYQAYAVGKVHVYPQRDRIGFDDVILDEEGRTQYGVLDDYALFLGDQGYAGQQFTHGMSNNQYHSRPWHLPEICHVTNWATQQMARVIKRRDPTRPGFWYLSYCHPHPPLVPLQCYLDMYRDINIDLPYFGEWSRDENKLPFELKSSRKLQGWSQSGKELTFTELQTLAARRAFYALCTHIDHQIRIVIGTLRDEGLLNNTIILFTSDHGDMLGNHGLWGKRLFYQSSANIPMILIGVNGDQRVRHHQVDTRLVGLQDVMPTLLDLSGITIPPSVEGTSMVKEKKREIFYGEIGEQERATRMIHDGRFKLIYYPVGNRIQLFDLEKDPRELKNLSAVPTHAQKLEQLTKALIHELYGGDEHWVKDGKLLGLPDKEYIPHPNRSLSGQRGTHWPPPPPR